ncbi:SET domain-containing protein 4 [Bulinus truncatus]|nr:SET domain-containing protein 4 [Bulinus truncatus]
MLGLAIHPCGLLPYLLGLVVALVTTGDPTILLWSVCDDDLSMWSTIMRNKGRCGRYRKLKSKNSNDKTAVSESHLPEFIRFHQWIKNSLPKGQYNSWKKNHLEPAIFSDTGRGLKSKHHLEKGDVIVSIPNKLMITTNTVFSSELGPIIQSSGYKFTPQQLLTVFLLTEQSKEEHSYWYPYINLLPPVYSSSVNLSNEELKLLTTRAFHLAVEYRDRFESACKKILAFLEGYVPSCKCKVNLENIKWAWSTIDTRSVYLHSDNHPLLVLDPDESHVALAPFLDLLNHKDRAQIRAGINPDSLSYEIITDDEYKKHEQIFISYGPHDNTRLAVNYGFTIPNNIHNVYYFSLEDIKACVSCDLDDWDQKETIIKESGYNQNLLCYSDGLSWSLTIVLNIIVTPKELLSSWKSVTHDRAEYCENNNLVYVLAKKLLTDALSKARIHLQNVVMQPKSTHFHIAESLAFDDVQILETSLKSLHSTFLE